MSRLVSLIVLTVIVGLFGFLSLRVLSSFLLPLFIAVMLVVMFRPLHQWFIRRLHGRIRLAAGCTTLAILVIVLLPLVWILAQATSEVVAMVRNVDRDSLIGEWAAVRERMGLADPPPSAELKTVQENAKLVDGGLKQLRKSTDRERLKDLADVDDWTIELSRSFAALPPLETPDPAQGAVHQAELAKLLAAYEQHLAEVRQNVAQPEAFAKSLSGAEDAFNKFEHDLFEGPPPQNRVLQWIKQLDLDEKMDELGVAARKEAEQLAIALPTQVFDFIVGFIILIVALYYFLADGPSMIDALMRLSPLDDRYEVQLLAEFSTLTRAIIVSMLLAAFIQGILAGVAYFVVGFESVFLLTVLTMLFAMVPFVGATVIWGGAAAWLFLVDGRTGAAIGLAIYCTCVVSMADNVIKPYILHGRSNLHPLLGLLSVLGGAKALGPIGLVVGPMVVALLQTLLVMLRNELSTFDDRSAAAAAKSAVAAVPAPPTVLPSTPAKE